MTVTTRGRRILVHGLTLVLAGLVWGLVVPLTPFPRLALTAHIQFEVNGLLVIALATLLLTVPHRVGPRSLAVMQLAAWLIWLLVLSEVANAWWGTNQTLPIAASQAGATGGAPWQELVVKLTHIAGGIGLIAAWTLLIIGFVRPPRQDTPTG
jgi:hydroxylaminobenzene mutase